MSLVLLERPEDGIALIRINRPDKRNALNLEVRKLLAERFTELGQDPGVRAIVLTGGEHFAAGADIRDMAEAGAIEMMQRNTGRLYDAIAACPKPAIAAVTGFALGGGCELAMCADIIIAGEQARFGQPEVKVGILPGGGGTQRLTRAVGKFRAMYLMMTGEMFSAQEALNMGLVSKVVPEAEVLSAALACARAIAALPPLAVMQVKELVLAGMDASLQTGLQMERKALQLLFASADQKEGMRAFIEKRAPKFQGR